ncbi:MAG: phosphoglycerate kinase [Candidatus Paceibacterota bacterium]
MKYLSSLKSKNLSGQICLLRADFNIEKEELSGKGVHPRISAVLPAINFLIERGVKVVILSHRGRPDPKTYKLKPKTYTLKPFAAILSGLLKEPVEFIELDKMNSLKKSDFIKSWNNIFLLENLRFNPGEDKNDSKFAKKLSLLGDFYINEAFAFCHRPAASVVGIPKLLPSYAGFSLESEIKNLSMAMVNPKKPLIVILGGIKVADKIGLIKNFWKKADKFLIGGGIANTFFAAQKMPMGNSLYEKDKIVFARKLLKSAKVILPVDSAIKGGSILDIGPETEKEYTKIINSAKTIIWNGPMGYIEDKKFRHGSEAILKAILKSKAFSVIGGGETTAILKPKTYKPKANIFISTGGGAMLEFLAGKNLPGIKALK